MRALLIGAVESTRVALDALASAAGWSLVAVATLPPELAARHSDFVDLSTAASRCGAELLHVRHGNSPEFLATLARLLPDIVFVIGWSQLCGPEIRRAVNGRVVGYHPAPLPRLRGRGVIPWTILLDEKITASTLFWIDDGVDSGPIIAQQFFHVAPGETAQTLYDKHMRALAQLMAMALPRLAAGQFDGERQDESLATWAARRRPEDGRIDWRQPADAVHRLIRATGKPYPGAFTAWKNEQLVIWQSEPCTHGNRHHALPGQVITRDEKGFAVACGNGEAIRVTAFDAAGAGMPPLHAVLGR